MTVDAHGAGVKGLAPSEAAKLVRILSRLGSPYDGERAAAGLLASAFVARHGLDWRDLTGLLKPVPEKAAAPEPSRSRKERRRSNPAWRGYCRRRRTVAGLVVNLLT